MAEVIAETHHSVHIPQWKKDEITEIVKGVHSHKVIGLVDVRGVPANALQKMKQELRSHVVMKMTRNNLAHIAFDSLPESIKARELSQAIDGQMLIIYTDTNPFKLFQLLEATKSKAPARGGDIAPEDIKVPAGPTSFKPGPIVGDLQQVGIPAAIDKGKVTIKSEKLVVRKGEKISAKLAEMLTRLDIFPMEIGLKLKSVVEGNTIYHEAELSVYSSSINQKIALAAMEAMNLSVEAGIASKDSITPLIQKAALESKAIEEVVNSKKA
jgi:large subunit ribosomal protein L10